MRRSTAVLTLLALVVGPHFCKGACTFTTYLDHTLEGVKLSVKRPKDGAACQQACSSEPRCKAAVFRTVPSTCTLMTAAGDAPKPSARLFAYVAKCTTPLGPCTYTRYDDSQIIRGNLAVQTNKTPEACETLCTNNARCVAFVHNPTELNCALKSTAAVRPYPRYHTYVETCAPPAATFTPVPGGMTGTAAATVYWNCCKPSSAWRRPYLSSTVRSCAADGVTRVSPNVRSACGGGGDAGPAYTCSDQAPFERDGAGYAFAAVGWLTETDTACKCFQLTLPGGRTMAVQATNIGNQDVGQQIDLQVPGGGQGWADGCTPQWGPGFDWGDQHAGVPGIEGCANLPSAQQEGCRFRFTFLDGLVEPIEGVAYVEIECPSALSSVSQCARAPPPAPLPVVPPGLLTDVPGGLAGTAITTRYWDCCKPSSSWGQDYLTTPVRACRADGMTTVTSDMRSICGDPEGPGSPGQACACSDQQPFVHQGLGYGFVAAGLLTERDSACLCFLLTYPDGVPMVVQATNIGHDLEDNQLDVLIPGAGPGFFDGCPAQWGEGFRWGERYGGIYTIEACDQLPAPLQAGCKFRFTYLRGTDNPNVEYKQIECPSLLTDISGCVRRAQ